MRTVYRYQQRNLDNAWNQSSLPGLARRANLTQQAITTAGPPPANRLGVNHYERVEFIVQLDLRAELILERQSYIIVRLVPGDKSQPGKQAACVGVNDKHWPVKGIQQHVVSRLGANPVDRQQGSTQHVRIKL